MRNALPGYIRDGLRPRTARLGATLVVALLAALALGSAPAAAQDESGRVLLYTGTTGYRHADAINQGAPVVQQALEDVGYEVVREDCDNNGGGANNCDHPDKNPRIFAAENLANYDAILLFNASASWAGGSRPGPLWDEAQRAAIIGFMQDGGGIAANHNATDMGAGQVSWNWWDGGENSAVGSLMRGHARTDRNNRAEVEVADRHHHSTRDLPDTYEFGDEHYNFARSVRGTHHVLATLDERTYEPGGNAMGQDHPISWCKLYDGDSVEDGTGNPKPYSDGRVWVTGMGHFGASYAENDGDNELVKHVVGGVRWAAGEGKKSDCSGTVWSSFERTILVDDVNGPIGMDVAPDGKVYWSEIGPNPGYNSEGYIKVHDPQGEPNNKTTVGTIPTRADHGNSEDGVLGMTLEPGFDLSDPEKRDVYVYYSPRNPAWPTSGNQQVVGYNQISRFTLSADGMSVVEDSERVILRVPKAKISGSPSGFPGGPTDSGPGHVGGAGLEFDSEGNLYLGVGDDVSPNAGGHDAYAPMDYRAAERWDARKTSANSADLRGKILRIDPLDEIPTGTEPDVDATYAIPEGNMFEPGTENTRPEIYAMGFRQPFTIHTDPADPGSVVVGEYCHDNRANQADRAPAGVCEWNKVDEPAFHGWPLCMGDNAPINSTFRWDYANDESTGQQYNCSQDEIPSDIRWAPDGQTSAEPTFDGLDALPGPAATADVWMKGGAPGGPDPLAFGDLSAGGRSPVTGPIYRYDDETAGQGAFPAYYDGSWFITNRGSDNGFWKEVRLRSDDNEMLRVNDWIPAGGFGSPNNAHVIPSQFGPDGALYMATWHNGCCRSSLSEGTQTQLIKIESAVVDECLEDTAAPNVNHTVDGREHPDVPGTYLGTATLTLRAGDSGCAGVDTIEYRVNSDSENDWQEYTEPVELEPGEHTIEYRATDTFDNVSAVEETTVTVAEINDQEAPTVTGELSGSQNEDGHYTAPATLTVEATDELTRITSIEYRVNQADEWTTVEVDGEQYSATITEEFGEPGFQYVEYRATDGGGNTSEVQSVSFSVVAGCEYARSDEFDAPLDARWLRHTRTGGTPTEGPMAPRVEDGQLIMPTNDFELDAASETTALGPVNFLGQDLAQLGDDWEVETQFTIEHNGGWQHVGLILWKGDNNFFRSTITHSLSGRSIYVESSKDNPTTTEGSRQQAGSNVTISPTPQPITIRMRFAREDGSNFVTAQYRVMAPANLANDDWVDFPGASDFRNLDVGGGVRRDGEGSRIGIIAAGNFPGSTGAGQYQGTPAEAIVDYFRVTPDQATTCPDDDVEPPTTTVAGVEDGGTYAGGAELTLTGADEGENASGVAAIEYRVDGGEWVEDTSGEPVTVSVDEVGEHTVEYRARDAAGNLEVAKSVTFTVEEDTGGGDDTTAPVTTADLDPANPGAGGTYDGPVDVTLSATDPSEGGGEEPEPQEHDVFASGTTWDPAQVDATVGDVVTWNFPDPEAGTIHDVWLVAPGDDPETDAFEVTDGFRYPGDPPVSYTVDEAGTWTYLCTIHPGMDGTIDVAEAGGGGSTASGVEFTEYRVTTDGEAGDWVRSDNDGGEDPFETSFTVSAAGSHTIDYRSTDGEGNVEADKSVAFSIGDDGGGEGAPTVQAFADPTSGPAPLRVRFSATGLDPDGGSLTYRWEFEDGAALNQSVVHTFREPGVHEATVTVTDDEGDSTSETIEVEVTDPSEENQAPTVEASVNEPSGPAPHRVRFDATGNDPDGRNADLVYHWEFGDGGESFARRPGHTYREPGTYTATVTVTDPQGGEASAEVEVEVTNPPGNEAPTVEAAALPQSGMAPLSTLLSAQGTDPDGDRLTYTWELGDGQSAEGRVVRHVYLLGGTYTATVTVSDGNGGTATAEVEVTVGNPPGNQTPTVRVAADPIDGNAPLRVRFTSAASDPDGDQLMYVWEFGDGGMAGGPSATHTYAAVGTYNAKLTVTDPSGASASATVTVVVSAPPAPPIGGGGDEGDVAGETAGTFAAIRKPRSVARFRRKGVRVTVACDDRIRGKAVLRIGKRAAKRLGIKRRTIAVKRRVRCAAGDEVTFRLKPRRGARRAIASASPRRLKVALRVKVRGGKDLKRTFTIR